MFYRIANLKTNDVTELAEPWNFDVSGINFDVPKDEYKKNYTAAGANHCLVSLVEGTAPQRRVTKDNEARVIHGFMGDYDGVFVPEMMVAIRTNPPTPYNPAYAVLTQSKRLRLVWLFERPVQVLGNVHAHDFLHIVAANIKAVKWGSDYDPVASEGERTYMDIGRKWMSYASGSVIPSELLFKWDYDLFKRNRRVYGREEAKVPIDLVKAEAEKRWPGRTRPDFRIGAHCCRFWDPESDNENGCLVYDDGVRVFVPHDKPFMSWTDIFGKEFTDAYVSKEMSPVLMNTWYTSSRKVFIRYLPAEHQFVERTPSDLKADLSAEAGISLRTPRGADLSPADEALHMLRSKHEIAYAAPVLYHESGVLRLPSLPKPILNTSFLRVCPPAADPDVESLDPALVPEKYRTCPSTCEWDNPVMTRDFPHIYSLLTALFCRGDQRTYDDWVAKGRPPYQISGPGPRGPNVQLLTLLGWLAYFYRESARLSPKPGQVLVLSGDAGLGKTFFARSLLGALMGGAVDAAKYFIDGEKYTGSICSMPVLLLDDAICAMSQTARAKFTERLKTAVATGCIRYEEKFHDSVESLPWCGRVVITCNSDPRALSVLPDLDSSNRDKTTMLKLGAAKFPFGSWEENQVWLAQEVPYFARFLMGYRPPDTYADIRFGVKAYQHPDMMQASADNGFTRTVVEALVTTFSTLAANAEKSGGEFSSKKFDGSASGLYDLVKQMCPSAADDIGGARMLSMNLQILQRSGYPILSRKEHGVVMWSIPFGFAEAKGEQK